MCSTISQLLRQMCCLISLRATCTVQSPHAAVLTLIVHVAQVGQHALKSDEGAAAATALLAQCPSIVRAGAKQLQEKSPRTRAGMFQVRAYPGRLDCWYNGAAKTHKTVQPVCGPWHWCSSICTLPAVRVQLGQHLCTFDEHMPPQHAT